MMIREDSVWDSNRVYYIVRTKDKIKNITVSGWWVRKVRFVKLKSEPAVGHLGLRLDQFISGRLKSPSIIMVGRGEGSNMTYVWIFNNISSKSVTEQEGGR